MTKKLFSSLDELIALDTLQQYVSCPVTAVQKAPLDARGVSGSQLYQVTAGGESCHRFVLKRMSVDFDWLMQTSNDRRCRSVSLWLHDVLDQLSPPIDHAILGCARQGDDWFLLMRDVSPHLLPDVTWDVTTIKRFLSALAVLHATFWNDPGLAAPALGLCDTRTILETTSVPSARRIPSDVNRIPRMITEGWTLLQPWLEPDVKRLLTDLQSDPTPLCDAVANYPKTLVHGDFRPANLASDPAAKRPAILLDWQFASYALPTTDLSWFLNSGNITNAPLTAEAAVSYYHQRLTEQLGQELAPVTWQAMRDLGELIDTMRSGVLKAWLTVNSPSREQRATESQLLDGINAKVRRARRWL